MTNIERKIELLAPAKDKSAAIAAIDAGADAVYTGYLRFGARKLAGNSLESIKEIVDYAHIYRASVYVTLNTIYTDSELTDVIKIIYDLYEIGVDAIIIQDMGILNSKLPPIRIFASTQCHNDSIEKIKFLENIGIERVILPREFSLSDIKNITDNSNIDVETFVHGALCVSYSGQCYFSCANGGRSANRGECAQPCRKKYSLFSFDNKIIAKDRYLLSLKDLNLSKYLKDLISAGVSSFKIEGRLKDECYVKDVVAYYRQQLDTVLQELDLKKSSVGISYSNFIPDLKKSFNRGFTDYFVEGKRKNFCSLDYVKSLGEISGRVLKVSKSFFTYDKNILNVGDGICFFDENNELTGTRIQKIDNGKIYPNSMKDIKSGLKLYRNFDKNFNSLLLNDKINRKIPLFAEIVLNKNFVKLSLKDEENNFCSVSINDKFNSAIKKQDSIIKENLLKTGGTEFEIKDLLITKEDDIFIPTQMINRLRRETIEKLREIRKDNFIRVKRKKEIVPTKYPKDTLDYSANVLNSKAEDFYKKCGVKNIEPALELTFDFSEKKIMTSKHCIKYTLGLCKKYFRNVTNYKEPLILSDEKNKKYLLKFDCKKCIMEIVNQ